LGNYINGSQCLSCSSAIPNCYSCSSASYCSSCYYLFSLSQNRTACICSIGYYMNSTTSQCSSCPYDCYACDSALNCLSCNASNYRELDSNTLRCVPMVGRYETGQNFANPCAKGCISCSNDNDCQKCK
jgi:proprotein convertase subtilisin/kexin type 5